MSGILMASVGNSYGAPPLNTVAPAVTGTATFGQTLTTTNGTWTGLAPITFTYQWFRSPSTSISGATSSTYVLVQADVGFGIFCQVRATNSVAPSGVTANSNTTATVAAVVPGAPTIGTATSTGVTTATVAFTAPASNGGATITQYDAVSSPAGGTGTLVQAGSGTINVTGLTGNTSYTFTVKATNSVGQSAASAASNSITTSFAWPAGIGAAYGGGFYAGSINIGGTGYYLIIADKTVGESSARKWGVYGTATGITSVTNGPTNTTSLAALGSAYEAAIFCENLNTGGFTDWYLPATNELEVCYYYLKPGTQNNDTNDGLNPNGVSPEPTDQFYAGNRPVQTLATNFRTGASSQEFALDFYWTSTEYAANPLYFGEVQYFLDGSQSASNKSQNRYTRAVRRVAPPAIPGQAYGGGYFVGLISTSANGVPTHYLIVSDITVGQTSVPWGPMATNTGITSVINGSTNSAALAALGAAYEAATFCEGLNTGGYTDWYMPALNELEVCYYYLKPGVTANNTGTGANANAVTPESISIDYVTKNPPQTSATNFRTGASAQEFATVSPSPFYYTSTQATNDTAYVIRFTTGEQNPNADKNTSGYYLTRAIRKVAI